MKDKQKFEAIPCLIFTYNPYIKETDTLYSNNNRLFKGVGLVCTVLPMK